MFCFLQLPFHNRSSIRVGDPSKRVTRRIYQMLPPGLSNISSSQSETILNLNDEHPEKPTTDLQKPSMLIGRRLLFRRSQSEPHDFQSSSNNTTSRTDPEWNINVESVSLQSSFFDYQFKRKNRLRKSKRDSVTTDSETPMKMEKENIITSLDFSMSDNGESNSTEAKSSMLAKGINYEDDIRQFVESTMLSTNIFADPFESDERRSRTEQWVEALSPTPQSDEENENEKEKENKEISTEEENEERIEDQKYDIFEESTAEKKSDESIVSSTVTVDSLKKSGYRMNLQEATEIQSEIDIKDVDRFWDYLYQKEKNETSGNVSTESRLNQTSNDHPVLSRNNTETTHMDEQDREIEEVFEDLDEIDENYFHLEKKLDDRANLHILTDIKTMEVGDDLTHEAGSSHSNTISTRNAFSQTELSETNQSKPEDKIENRIIVYQQQRSATNEENIYMFFSTRFFEDLKVLVAERDRAKVAMRVLPQTFSEDLSPECNYYQARYRIKIEQNKSKLDRRIDETWRKLINLPVIKNPEIKRFINVTHSGLLTFEVNHD